MDTMDSNDLNKKKDSYESYKSPHPSLVRDRLILFLDSPGKHCDICVKVIQKILPQAKIDIVSTPEEAEKLYLKTDYDTYIFNFLAVGVSCSSFVKKVLNDTKLPLIVGFSLDQKQMDIEEEIKHRPLQRIFEIN